MAAGGNYTVHFNWPSALVLAICCILTFLTFNIFPDQWVCGGLCDEQLQAISGIVSQQKVLDTPCPEGVESICWKGVLELRYELPPGQNHTCSLRVIKNSPTHTNIEYAFKIKWLMDSTINATIQSQVYDHCFQEAELNEMRIERNQPFWVAIRFISTLMVGSCCVLFLVEGWKAGLLLPFWRFEYDTLNVQDPPQDEEAKLQ